MTTPANIALTPLPLMSTRHEPQEPGWVKENQEWERAGRPRHPCPEWAEEIAEVREEYAEQARLGAATEIGIVGWAGPRIRAERLRQRLDHDRPAP